MRWSWRIATLAGIGVYMHVTFLLVLGWVVAVHYMQRYNWSDALDGLIFIVVIFAIVVLHELGHALAARKFGIATRDITLLPIGGVARLERMPEDPKQELLVALAGPAVNVVLALLVLVLLVPYAAVFAFEQVLAVGGQFLLKLFWVNVVLAGFNLIPAFPMDGGRVLRALLALKIDYVRATEIAATTGQTLAFAFGFLGLFTNPFLVFIALFVWMGAAQEASMVTMKSALAGIPISHLMITDYRTLRSDDPLGRAIDHILSGSQEDFPVVDGYQVVGVLTRSRLLTSLANAGQEETVGEVMERDFATASPSEMAQTVFERLQTCNCRTLPVVGKTGLQGIVTAENLGEFLMIRQALTKRGRTVSNGLSARV